MKFIFVFFKFKPFDSKGLNSVQNMFAFHCTKIIQKYYSQSEFTVGYIHFVVSRVDSSFKVKLNWLMSAIKLIHNILLYIKTFSSKDFFFYFKNNSPYFLIYNAEEYENIFEKDFIYLNEFS